MPETYLTSTEQQGKITSHGLLATRWLMQSRRLMDFVAVKADCWLVVSLVSAMAPNSFSLQSYLSLQLATWCQKSGAASLLHPIQCQTWLQYLQRFIPVKLQSLGRRYDTFLSCYLWCCLGFWPPLTAPLLCSTDGSPVHTSNKNSKGKTSLF